MTFVKVKEVFGIIHNTVKFWWEIWQLLSVKQNEEVF